MPKIDLCIDPVFVGMDTGEKIRRVANLGYQAVEFWFWDHVFDGRNLIPFKKNIREIGAICKDLDVVINDIVVNSPDGSIGGFLTKRSDQSTYLERLKETIEVAHELNCNKMITCTGNLVETNSEEEQQDNILNTLSLAADLAHKENMTLLLEALNSTVDHPGYFLTSSAVGFDIIHKINSPHLRLLYDIYHMQIMEGNHIATIQKNIHLIGHFHSAGVPGRNEIYLGEVNYLPILKAIDETGYKGFFGLEYWPTEPDEMSLKNSMAFLKSYSEIVPEEI